MKIEWNKVTWYSKFVALLLFVALPFVGFVWGMHYGEMVAPSSGGIGTQNGSTTTGQLQAGGDYYQNVAAWQTDQRPDAGFSVAAPLDFGLNDNYAITPTPDWRIGSNQEPGNLLAKLAIPSTFEPQTNFADAKLTVGKSTSQLAVANCLKPDQGGTPNLGTGTATTTINGVTFSIFKSADAGAGNFYETTSYRMIHAGACYAVEYTIHSSQIANYPAQYNLQQFDRNKATDVLDRIVGTFKLL